MKFFIDSANIDEIRDVYSWGVLGGVTTNPTLVAKENVKFEDRLKEITAIVKEESVSAEVLSLKYEEMVEEGKKLAQIAPNITIKVPMTVEGLKAVHTFKELDITTNVTLIFNANQALLAARAGATYVSPFLGRLDDIGQDGLSLIKDIAEIFEVHGLPTQIIAASIRNPIHVTQAALHGAHIATIPYKVLKGLTEHPLTTKGIQLFLEDWNASKTE